MMIYFSLSLSPLGGQYVHTYLPGVNKKGLTTIKNYCIIFEVAGVAQSVEQGTENPCVGGSIPSPGTFFMQIFHVYNFNKIVIIT